MHVAGRSPVTCQFGLTFQKTGPSVTKGADQHTVNSRPLRSVLPNGVVVCNSIAVDT